MRTCGPRPSQALNFGSTIKGVWSPRVSCKNGEIIVDWLDAPSQQKNNAYIFNIKHHKKAFNSFLNAFISNGDIVFFGPDGTVLRYIPFGFSGSDTGEIGELGMLDILTNQWIQDGTIEVEKLSTWIQDRLSQTIPTVVYNNDNETTYPVINIPSGRTFTNYTFQDLMRDLFYSDEISTEAFDFEFEVNADGIGIPDESRPTSINIQSTQDGIIGRATVQDGTYALIKKINNVDVAFPYNITYQGVILTVQENGTFNFSLNSQYESLPINTNQIVNFTYEIYNPVKLDSDVGNISITVYGTNKAPYISQSMYNGNVESTDNVSVNFKSYFQDINSGETATLDISVQDNASLPGGLTYNDITKTLTGELSNDAHAQNGNDGVGKWKWNVTATDVNGQSSPVQTAKLTVTRPKVYSKAISKTLSFVGDGFNYTYVENLLSVQNTPNTKDRAGLRVNQLDGNTQLVGFSQYDKPFNTGNQHGTFEILEDGTINFIQGDNLKYVWSGSSENFTIAYNLINDMGQISEVTNNITMVVNGTRTHVTTTDPQLTFNDYTILSGNPQNIGETIQVKLTASFNKGTIKQGGIGSTYPRTGLVSDFVLNGTGVADGSISLSSQDTTQKTSVTMQDVIFDIPVSQSNKIFTLGVTHDNGIQPLDSIGENDGVVYSSQTNGHQKTITLPKGTKYPYWLTSGQAIYGELEDQGYTLKTDFQIVSDSPQYQGLRCIDVYMDPKAPSAERAIRYPVAFKELKTIQVYNDMLMVFGDILNWETLFAKTTVQVDLGGEDVDYYDYRIQNNNNIGPQRYRFIFKD